MNPERWQKINQIYHEVLSHPEESQETFLGDACAGDEELRKEIERLLASHRNANGFLENPVVELGEKPIPDSLEFTNETPVCPRVVVAIERGPHKGKRLLFSDRQTCIFGRASDCFEILPDEDLTIGRHHFVLDIDPPRVRIKDLGTLNGTYINGQKIASAKAESAYGKRSASRFVALHNGDCFQAGGTIFRLSIETASNHEQAPKITDAFPLIANYEPIKTIGRGKLGVVYLVRNKETGQRVALKVISLKTSISEEIISNFRSKILEISDLGHPNLLKMIDESSQATLCLVSNYCECGNLSDFLARRKGALPLPKALPIMRQVLEAIAYVHNRGFWHGNLISQNILLCGPEPEGQVRVSDLGLRQIFQDLRLTSLLRLDEAYNKTQLPELSGSSFSKDVWNIGAVFYQMLTGFSAFDQIRASDSSAIPANLIASISEHNTEIAPEIARLIDDSLNFDPKRRPESVLEMLNRFKGIQMKVVRLTILR